MLGIDVERAFDMNVYTIFNYYSFIMEYRRQEQKEMEKYKLRH